MIDPQDDAIGDALERQLIETKIERAFNQFEPGEFFSYEESRSDMEKRKGA